MSSEVKNLEAVSRGLEIHDKNCEFPVYEIQMNPFEVERLGWDTYPHKGKLIPIIGEPKVPTGMFYLRCDGQDNLTEEQAEEVLDVVSSDRELEFV